MEWKARRRPREEGTGKTPQAQAEEAYGPPAGKRSAWNGNQQDFILSQKKTCGTFEKSPT
ncbi:hypothetical protein B4U37_06335 [Sutcliffiella horikoshii]|uniref:Uncharacterized protein n=1 Tax=Sutcliffiella horikoshii TaxID=79883 RepID=A0A1Y0CK48_9BACI|nr:hypothetical protein B4U37_06335 [Sutcliffiella horikoshii]TYS60953.1 hypothetical protein FZC74_01340 [Sutcliffiella horikoshii]